MTAYGKPGKRWCCFPPFPQALEIKKRFSHYHRHDEYENEQVFHLRSTKNFSNYRDHRIQPEVREIIASEKLSIKCPHLHTLFAVFTYHLGKHKSF